MFPVIAMQIFDFKNSIIVIKLFLVMILNMHLTSEIQNDLKVSLILCWLTSDAHFPQVGLISGLLEMVSMVV